MSDRLRDSPASTVFGLRVSSPLPLWRGVANWSEPDLVVELGRPRSADEAGEPPPDSIDLARSPIEFLFPRVARYRVDSGRTISVVPEPHADLGLIAQVTRGIAIAVALHQRGRVLLHGSCLATTSTRCSTSSNRTCRSEPDLDQPRPSEIRQRRIASRFRLAEHRPSA
jgi:hypothetical protein